MTDPSDATVADDDRRRLRAGGGAVPWSPTIVDGSIPARFAEIVRRFPDRPAVVAGGTSISYAALDARSSAIASTITSVRGESGEMDDGRATSPEGPRVRPVALLLDQGIDLPAAVMGALRTGAPFVPIDPAYPDPSLCARLDHAGAAIVLATASTIDVARRVAGGRPVIDLGSVADDAATDWGDPSIEPDDPATLFYTSGSTGRPKGVLDSHRNVLHNVGRYSSSLLIGPEDRLTLLHAPTFSGIVSTLFAALSNGAAILPFDLRHEGLDRARSWLATEQATMLHCVPMVARALFFGTARYPDLRVVRLEGDLATWSDVDRFVNHTDRGAMLVNGLGATETGLTRQFFVVNDVESRIALDERTGALPIGYPVPDMTLTIRDANGRPIEDGTAGEMVVASRFLALGYHGDPERTAQAFGVDPDDPSRRMYRTGDLGRMEPDGRTHHLGRVDGAAKVSGQTVDLGETERALEAQPGVRAAVAVTRRDGPVDAPVRLLAYVVREPDQTLDLVKLRHDVASTLSDVQVPSVIVEIPAVPVTSAGKIDRAALPAPGHARPPLATPYRPASDPLEEELVSIWSALIGVAPVGIDDDFFELGGDSFAALNMLLELGSAYGRELPAEMLVRSPSIAMLADELRGTGQRPDWDLGAGVRLAEGHGPTVFAIHAAVDRPWYLREIVRTPGWSRPFVSIGPDRTATTLQDGASVEAAADLGMATIRAVQPTGPYHLAGFCYGGVVAFEIAHRLRDAGEDVDLLALVSVSPLEFPTLVSPDARRRYRRAALRGRVQRLLERWQADGPVGAFHAAVDRTRRTVERTRYRRRVTREGSSGQIDGSKPDAPDMRAARAAAIDAYEAHPYDGEVTVVIGRGTEPHFVRDPQADFAGLSTRPVHPIVLASDEHTMLEAPGADALARALAGGRPADGRYDSPHGG